MYRFFVHSQVFLDRSSNRGPLNPGHLIRRETNIELYQLFQSYIDKVCLEFGFAVGHCFIHKVVHPDGFYSANVWYLKDSKKYFPFLRVTESLVLNTRSGCIGLVSSSEGICTVNNLADCDWYLRAPYARDLSLGFAVFVPLILFGRICAVFEFYSTTPSETLEAIQLRIQKMTEGMAVQAEKIWTDQVQNRPEDWFQMTTSSMFDYFGTYSAVRGEDGQILDFKTEYIKPSIFFQQRKSLQIEDSRTLLTDFPSLKDSLEFEDLCSVVETGVPIVKPKHKDSVLIGNERFSFHLNYLVIKVGDGVAVMWNDVSLLSTSKQNPFPYLRDFFGRLSRCLAHEIGNPLTSILGNCHVLKGVTRASPQSDPTSSLALIEKVEAQSKRISQKLGQAQTWMNALEESNQEFILIADLISQALNSIKLNPALKFVQVNAINRTRPDCGLLGSNLVSYLVKCLLDEALSLFQGSEKGTLTLELSEASDSVEISIQSQLHVSGETLPSLKPYPTPGHEAPSLNLFFVKQVLESLSGTLCNESTPESNKWIIFLKKVY